jgi:hypothetical protein
VPAAPSGASQGAVPATFQSFSPPAATAREAEKTKDEIIFKYFLKIISNSLLFSAMQL